MQVCPAFPNLAQINLLTVNSKLQVSSTMVGFDPPNSRTSFDKFFEASFMTNLPTIGLPMNTIASKGRQFNVLLIKKIIKLYTEVSLAPLTTL